MSERRTSLLELVPAIRPGDKTAKGVYKTERHFLDFVVDSKSLYQSLSLSKGLDLISPLALDDEDPAAVMEAISRLLLEQEADFPNNRRALFVCPECGDLACGAVTAIIERQESRIVWRDFGYENTYENEVSTENYSDIGPFAFDAQRYDEALRSGVLLIGKTTRRI